MVTSTKTRRKREMIPYTYGEIRELYRNFAGQRDELKMLMDFSGLRKADAQLLLDNLKNDIGGKAS